MSEAGVIGLDPTKHVFEVHRADASGRVVVRKRPRRAQVLAFCGRQPRCVVAIKASSSPHFWAREIGPLGHEVRLLPRA